jgi:hypothetical protein
MPQTDRLVRKIFDPFGFGDWVSSHVLVPLLYTTFFSTSARDGTSLAGAGEEVQDEYASSGLELQAGMLGRWIR